MDFQDFTKTPKDMDFQDFTKTSKDMHCSPRSVPVFLKERQAPLPHTGLDGWGGPSSNIRPRESGISRAQALPRDPNRFAINVLGLCTASTHREAAGVAWLKGHFQPLWPADDAGSIDRDGDF
jgi:hypothetical protein